MRPPRAARKLELRQNAETDFSAIEGGLCKQLVWFENGLGLLGSELPVPHWWWCSRGCVTARW